MILSNTQYHQAYIKALKPNGLFPSTDEIEFFDETTFKREEQEEKSKAVQRKADQSTENTDSSYEHSDVRAELQARGLYTKGRLSALRRRPDNYDTRGCLKGDLAAVSDQHLGVARKILSIESNGGRHQLVERAKVYNSQKRRRMGQEVDPGDINSGLPSPDNRLGKPAKYGKVLGTPGSGFHLKSYCLYLCKFEEKYKTTENAWTLRFFGIFMNPEVCQRSCGRPGILTVESFNQTRQTFKVSKIRMSPFPNTKSLPIPLLALLRAWVSSAVPSRQGEPERSLDDQRYGMY
ncbi:hypothetical protein BDR22DRAFT_885424 [Usnea florida]